MAEQGLSSTSDDSLIEVCRAERRCLVTLDLDFSDPLRFDPSLYSGIAVLRLPLKFMAGDLLDIIRTLAVGLASMAIEGRLWVVQRGRIREYRGDRDAGRPSNANR